MHAVMEQAQKELAQTGRLSVSTRQQLWLALGPAEVTDRDPCPLTEAVQKRAQLALACGKKVSRVWAAYDAQDKRPQTLLRQTSAYLQGKCTAEKLDRLLKDTNFMPLMDEERYSSAPLAALAAYWGRWPPSMMSPCWIPPDSAVRRSSWISTTGMLPGVLPWPGQAGTRMPEQENSGWKR